MTAAGAPHGTKRYLIPADSGEMESGERFPGHRLAQEVEVRFGLVPNFFCTATAASGLIDELWAFAKSAYLDSPLPSLFKERLFVFLSCFCPVRYCIVRHVGFLQRCIGSIGAGFSASRFVPRGAGPHRRASHATPPAIRTVTGRIDVFETTSARRCAATAPHPVSLVMAEPCSAWTRPYGAWADLGDARGEES